MYLKRYNQAKNHSKGDILFWLFDMSIICEHVLRLEIGKTFKLWVYVTMWQVYREVCVHACLKLNIVLISFLPVNAQHKIKKNLRNSSLWTC